MAARYDAFEAFSKDFDDRPGDLFMNSSPDYSTPRNGSLRSRPIGDMTGNSSFRERSRRLIDVENEKNQLIEVSSVLGSHCGKFIARQRN